MSNERKTSTNERKGPYRVEVDQDGCPTCLHEKSWFIIDPFDVAGGTSYYAEQDAMETCALLNDAYWTGFDAAVQKERDGRAYEAERII